MKIIPIALPTPFPVGDVNVYLIDGDPLTLVDTGPKTVEAVTALRESLGRNGFKLSDIRRIVLTHTHEDHCGLAKTIRDEAKNAEIYIHNWETGHLAGRLTNENQRILIRRAGVPDEIWRRMEEFYASFRLLSDALENGDFKELKDDAELEFSSGTWRILHTPGHTPGSCSLLRESNRTLLAGDCILKRITPNPILSPDPVNPRKRFSSLAEYLVSLAKIRSFAPTYIYTGHGEPVTDYEEIFSRYVRTIDERQVKVLSFVGKSGANAFEIAQKVFPQSFDKDSQLFLAVSEIVAHLDYAESNGKIAVELKDGIEFYRR